MSLARLDRRANLQSGPWPQSGLQHLLGRPAPGSPGPATWPARHSAGDHLGGMQRAGLRSGRAEAGYRRGRQSAAERAFGTQTGRHPQSRVRGLLRHVRTRAAGVRGAGLRGQAAALVVRRARRYWDRWITLFEQGNRRPFYYRGTSGTFALLVNFYINHVVRLRAGVDDVLATQTVEEQQEIYQPAPPRSLLVVRRCGSPCGATRYCRCWGCRVPNETRSRRSTKAVLPNSSSIASRRCFLACRCPTTTSGAST